MYLTPHVHWKGVVGSFIFARTFSSPPLLVLPTMLFSYHATQTNCYGLSTIIYLDNHFQEYLCCTAYLWFPDGTGQGVINAGQH